MLPVSTAAGRLAVLAMAVAVWIGFVVWSTRSTSASFVRGVLAGTGLFLSFDVVWVHWLFGLHRATYGREDAVLEPLAVFAGVVLLWYAIARECRAIRTHPGSPPPAGRSRP